MVAMIEARADAVWAHVEAFMALLGNAFSKNPRPMSDFRPEFPHLADEDE